ncbi:MAG: EscU/YscU/HrcU family type III secretion system export apparatus switch protein, partial [Candidatus Adiutrix sp.]|nr:EscU/YscU/HrcU family type III secretion system export apparatus switch protein [Candidatus Adiutrix sp.]
MSEKTEQPTPKKLRDARNQGQLAKSQEIPSAAVVLALIFYLALRWPAIYGLLSA